MDEQFRNRCCVVSQSDSGTNENLALAKTLIRSPPSSPPLVFVDRTADLELAARCSIVARFGFNGSSACAPGAVFVHEAAEKAFSAHLVEFLRVFLTIRDNLKESQSQDKTLGKDKIPESKEATDMEVLFSNSRVEIVVIRNR